MSCCVTRELLTKKLSRVRPRHERSLSVFSNAHVCPLYTPLGRVHRYRIDKRNIKMKQTSFYYYPEFSRRKLCKKFEINDGCAIIHSLKYFFFSSFYSFFFFFFFFFFFRLTFCIRAFRFSSALTLQLRMFFSFSLSLSLSFFNFAFVSNETNERTNERTIERTIEKLEDDFPRLIHGWRV